MTADSSVARSHPAKFNAPLLHAIAAHLEPRWKVLDPMAGVGRVHELAALANVRTWGIEIEPEWAEQHPRTVCADARTAGDLFHADYPFDALVTSPAYGNRMADQYDGRDGSRRHTYRTSLGRPLSDGSGAALQWGDRYRQLHAEVWAACVPLVRPGGRVIVNVKNHVRARVVQRVVEWHLAHLISELSLDLVAIDPVQARGIRHGANREREANEFVLVLAQPDEAAA